MMKTNVLPIVTICPARKYFSKKSVERYHNRYPGIIVQREYRGFSRT